MRKPELWAGYARLMDGFMSLDDVVATGIGICRHTAWRWRHRMLKVQALIQAPRVEGVVEAVLKDRSGIAAALEGRVGRGSVVCSDGLKAYVDVAVKHGSEHRRILPPSKDWLAKAVGGKPRKSGRMGLGRVNAHHERLKTFINRELRGVSTRYLHLYLGWARAMRRPGFAPPVLIEQALAA